jgi:hypothetical protein
MRDVAVALVVLLTLVGAYVVGDRISAALHARQTFHHMRYCPSPQGKFPAHPCADDEDEDEVIQAAANRAQRAPVRL